MMGRHEGPPFGSAAREATAAPYHGKRRAERDWPAELIDPWLGWPQPDDPPRCGSCGHVQADECGCSCCTWDEEATDG